VDVIHGTIGATWLQRGGSYMFCSQYVLSSCFCSECFKRLFQMIFSFVSAHLVRSFAKYAAGSGISEIKCILGGFVMKGYLGFTTFFIKSITLVRLFI
jgi:H+/Cl- antiporter ClcA